MLFTAGFTANDFEDSALQIRFFRSGATKTVHRGGYYGRYVATGHLVWAHQDALFAAAVDLGSAELKSVPLPVLDGLGCNPIRATGNFVVSPSGIFAALTGKGGFEKRLLYWLDASGKMQPLSAPPGWYSGLRLSPDGRRLAFEAAGEHAKTDVSIYEWERYRMSPLTFTYST
jgi:hypothetical protein